MTHLAVLGAGSWGTTFAKVLADAGSDVRLWARRGEIAREIQNTNRNSDYLPGINLPRNLHCSTDMADVLSGASQVYLAVPSQHLRSNLQDASAHISPDALVVSLMKGVEAGSGLRMSEVIAEEGIDSSRIAVVSGAKPRPRNRERTTHCGSGLLTK